MRAKMMIVTLIVVFCTVLSIPGTASAAGYTWRQCTVVMAGPTTTGDYATPGDIIIRLSLPDGRERDFTVKDSEKNRVLAVALAAISTGKMVNARVDWWHITDDYIDGIYLMR